MKAKKDYILSMLDGGRFGWLEGLSHLLIADVKPITNVSKQIYSRITGFGIQQNSNLMVKYSHLLPSLNIVLISPNTHRNVIYCGGLIITFEVNFILILFLASQNQKQCFYIE